MIGVYATAVFLVYGWTLLTSFWKVPSWLFYLSLDEILAIYAYSFVVDFFESVLVLLGLILVGFVLPSRWWNDRFISMGMIWLIVIEGSIMLRLYEIRSPELWDVFVHQQGTWWAYTVALGLLLSLVVARVGWLQSGLVSLSDRLVVFLYIYMPLTVISILVVLFRNIF